MTMVASVAAYEAWMRGQLRVVKPDLDLKHEKMAEDPFSFLRATCFRFAERLPVLQPALLEAHAVPSVGDAHLENFGTWRDAEGRLVWGVNDLDEAALLPWPVDLARLATSALLARRGLDAAEVAAALLRGYRERLDAPRPFVLDRENVALRDIAAPSPKERRKFWDKMLDLPEQAPARLPAEFVVQLRASLPVPVDAVRFATRQGGLGGLGRPRVLALAEWRGGWVVREAKARLPSAWLRAEAARARPLDMVTLAANCARAPDPCFRATETLVVRRLAPDSRRIEARPAELSHLLRSMGGELANFHAPGAAAIRAELARRPKGWLGKAARHLAETVQQDHADWVSHRKAHG